jgi:Fe-Mn family superoxide dismutase
MHTLPPLQYEYDALEPYIDEETMRIHHDKHHQVYINKLNDALSKYPNLEEKKLEELLSSLESLPAPIREMVRNNGGGHFNHSFFWKTMKKDGGGEPVGDLAGKIIKEFSSFDNFKKEFSLAAINFFGSGWAWLAVNKNGDLRILTLLSHDSPIMMGFKPLLVLDLWEHAYYLKYQNRRAEYIEAWWNVVDWNKAEENLN